MLTGGLCACPVLAQPTRGIGAALRCPVRHADKLAAAPPIPSPEICDLLKGAVVTGLLSVSILILF